MCSELTENKAHVECVTWSLAHKKYYECELFLFPCVQKERTVEEGIGSDWGMDVSRRVSKQTQRHLSSSLKDEFKFVGAR